MPLRLPMQLRQHDPQRHINGPKPQILPLKPLKQPRRRDYICRRRALTRNTRIDRRAGQIQDSCMSCSDGEEYKSTVCKPRTLISNKEFGPLDRDGRVRYGVVRRYAIWIGRAMFVGREETIWLLVLK